MSDLGKEILAAVDDGIARMVAKDTGEPRPGHYDDQRTTGFVVIHRYKAERTGRDTQAWWYGDEDVSGRSRYWNAWGDLDSSVAWFDTKVKAKLAMRRCGLSSRPGVTIQSVADAKAALADRLEEQAGKLMARAVRLRGRP